MGLYATFDVNTPQAKQQSELLKLIDVYKATAKKRPPLRPPGILLAGYLAAEARDDSDVKSTDRAHLVTVLSPIQKYLIQHGVSVDNIFFSFYHSSLKGHHHTVDIYLEEDGSPNFSPRWGDLPTNPGPPPTEKPKSAREKEISISSEKEVEFEVKVFKVFAGTSRTFMPEMTVNTSFSMSATRGAPVGQELSAELVAWKPKLEDLLKKVKLGKISENIEFDVKVKVSGKITIDESARISKEIGAKIQAAVTVKINRSVKVEFSFSERGTIDGGAMKWEPVPLIKVIWNF